MDLTMNEIIKGLLVALASVTHASCQGVMMVNDKSDLPHLLGSNNYRHIGSYPLLRVLEKCRLSQCPASTTDTINLYNYCFRNQCSTYDHYHCLNDSGRTIHFCAEFTNCSLRSIDKAVVYVHEPGIVNIFNVPCMYGQFQPNEQHSCFTECAKDTSIGILKIKNDTAPLAYCLPEIGCNAWGEMFFYLGTEHDDCTGTKRCLASEELLPDCSCDTPCAPNHVRLPENNFSCSPSLYVTSSTSNTEEATKSLLITSNATKRDKENVDITQSSQAYSWVMEKQTYTEEEEDNADSNTFSVPKVAIIAVASVFGVAALVGFPTGAVVFWMKLHKDKRDPQPKTYTVKDTEDGQSQKTETNVTIKVKAESATFCEGDIYNITNTTAGAEADADAGKANSYTASSSSQDKKEKMALLKEPDDESHPQYEEIREDSSLTHQKHV